MKRFRTFVLSDVIVWGLVNLIALAPIVWAIAYNWRRGLPVGAWVSLVATALAFVGITVYRFFRRWQWVTGIRWYTSHGTAVSFGGDAKWFLECIERAGPSEGRLGNRLTLQQTIERAIDDVIAQWPGARGAFNGAFLIILPEVWAQGVRYMGFAFGTTMAVAWDKTRNPGCDGLYRIIAHEAGHVALTALGVPATNEAQHPALEARGF